MSFDLATASHLKPWLVRTLEPICDAEPGALADYILALLKHNAPESDMRKELVAQLDEFLENECAPFIDTLFTVLRTKSYLPYGANTSYDPSSPPPVDTGIPIPLDVLLSPSTSTPPERTRKRSIDDDSLDTPATAKGPRLSADGQFSRYSNGRNPNPESRSTGGWTGRGERHASQGLNGQGTNGEMSSGVNGSMAINHRNGRQPQPYRPPDVKRGICRDYHNNGYCARGAYCKYSHGDDAVIPGQLFPTTGPLPGPLPFMPIFPSGPVPFAMAVGGTGSAYDPHEARMDMRPNAQGIGPGARLQSRAPILPRLQHEGGSQLSIHASGELPVIQDLTPQMDVSRQNNISQGSNNGGPAENVVDSARMQPQTPVPLFMSMEVDPVVPVVSSTNGHGGLRGGARGGRPRGTFGAESHNFRPERENGTTLVVEKIPGDKLSLDAVNGWFKRFGTVTNVAVDVANAKALVSFSTHAEAYAAWKSEDAVFNNRFVKLFWHRPMEGHGQVGARMLAASAPLMANISSKKPVPATVVTQPTTNLVSPVASTSTAPRKASISSAPPASALAAKQRLLEQQIAEQKRLMGLLETASSDEKKQIMTRLRQLGEEMKPSSGAAPTPTPVTEQPPPLTVRSSDREQKERERLDKELELHNATLAARGDAQETTDDLKAKLEKLKAEAASLGISDSMTEGVYGGSHRPYRGRGRGSRGYHRGLTRGGSRASMKLDNRPRKLLVKGVGDESIQAVRDWYKSTGQMESADTTASGDIVISFRTRSAAEQGLSKGSNIPPIGQVHVSWFTGQLSETNSQQTVAAEPNHATEDKRQSHSPVHIAPLSPQEEVAASGWGGSGDDGDGMGML